MKVLHSLKILNISIKKIISYVLFSFIVEFGICNFRFFESLPYKKILQFSDKSFNLSNNEDILIFNGNEKINNLYLDAYCMDNSSKKHQTIEISLFSIDEGNSIKYYLNTAKLSSFNRSKYIRLNASGNIKQLFLRIENQQNNNLTSIIIKELSLNKRVPLFFSFIRLIFIFGLLLFLNIFSTTSQIWNIPFSIVLTSQKKIIRAYVSLILALFLCLPLAKGVLKPEIDSDYNYLAESIFNGNFNLPFNVDNRLVTMTNPYDTNLRQKIFNGNNNNEYAWDTAFYNGNYYCYFGVVPVILTFLPFYAITKHHLPVQFAIVFFGAIFIISSFYLLKKIVILYFKSISFIYFIFLHLLFILCSGITYSFMGNYFYSLPILAGVSFAISGLLLWLDSTITTKQNSLNYKKIALGSLYFALIAGCRPQLILIFFIFPFIFTKYFIIEINQKKQLNYKLLLALSLPVIPIALFIMYYNYARFNSIFDFGANYNLTTNDMTHRGWKWDRLPVGIYTFLFEPSKIKVIFPFLFSSEIKTIFMGTTIAENNFGGLFFTYPILLIGCSPFLMKKYLSTKYKYISIFLISISFVILCMDIQMAGLVGSRYKMDFSWLLCITMILTICSIICKINENHKVFINFILKYSLLFAILYNTCLYLALARSKDTFANLIQFWG